jgi:hypothetical protein
VHVSSYDTTGGNRDRYEIAAGDSAVLLDLEGPGVVRRLWLTVASRDPHYLRRIALRMYWDGEASPSVNVPLGDFFGNGFDRRHYAALPMGVSSGGFYLYLPLPFRDHARIVAVNGTGRAVDAFYFNADVEVVDALPEPLATFHAVWHRDRRTTDPRPHTVLEATGSGRLVGMTLNAESLTGSYEFLEGDEIWTVDGEARGQGTGTEDYFNGGWYFEAGPFAAPWHGVVVKDDARGRIAAYRWHVPDPVNFRDSIRVELEHGHANREVADYATVAYWYQTEPHRPTPPLPPPDERRVLGVKPPPGAVTGAALAPTEVRGGTATVTVPVPRPDLYEVVVYPRGARAGGTARIRVASGTGDGVPWPPTWVTLSLGAEEEGVILEPVVVDTVSAVGEVALQVAGGPGALPAAVYAEPVARWATRWMVVGPFPNPQRIGTEHSAALDSVYPPERDPSLDRSYPAMDGRTVAWTAVDTDRDAPPGYVRLNPRFEPNDHVAAYAQAFLLSPDARDAVLLLGADDAHVLWVNGDRVSERQGRNISRADDLAVPVRLRAGWNRVMLKVADLDGGWAFQVRAADPTGELRWSPRPSPDAGGPPAPGRPEG